MSQRHRCDICGKCLSRSTKLREHRRSHTGEHPFECSTCKTKFARSYDLKKHKETHNGTHRYRCEFDQDGVKSGCGRGFHKKGDLNRHLKRDGAYICRRTKSLDGSESRQIAEMRDHEQPEHLLKRASTTANGDGSALKVNLNLIGKKNNAEARSVLAQESSCNYLSSPLPTSDRGSDSQNEQYGTKENPISLDHAAEESTDLLRTIRSLPSRDQRPENTTTAKAKINSAETSLVLPVDERQCLSCAMVYTRVDEMLAHIAFHHSKKEWFRGPFPAEADMTTGASPNSRTEVAAESLDQPSKTSMESATDMDITAIKPLRHPSISHGITDSAHATERLDAISKFGWERTNPTFNAWFVPFNIDVLPFGDLYDL
jgi:Zinc finger, C2H2 type